MRTDERQSASRRPVSANFAKTRAQRWRSRGCTTSKHASTNDDSLLMSTDGCSIMPRTACIAGSFVRLYVLKIALTAWKHNGTLVSCWHGTARLMSGDCMTLSTCSMQGSGAVNMLSAIVLPDEDGNCSTLCRPAAFIRSSSIEIIASACAGMIRVCGLSRAARSLRTRVHNSLSLSCAIGCNPYISL